MPHGVTRRGVVLGLGAAAFAACSDVSTTTSTTTPPGTSPTTGSVAPSEGSPTPATTAATVPGTPTLDDGSDITRGPEGSTGVALTFHGFGDVDILRRLLDALHDAAAQVTVLAVGQWLSGDPTIAPMILDAGHELGNHTWSHQTMTRLSPDVITAEIQQAADELRRQTGSQGSWFRPSGTPTSTPDIRAAAVAAGYPRCLSYDLDSLDYTDPGPDAVVFAVTAAVRGGSIVSLHLGHAGTVTALPAILADLDAKGLRAVTVSSLLGAA